MDNKFTEVEPVNTLRHGWFKGYQAEKDVDAWAGITETPAESKEWGGLGGRATLTIWKYC